MITDSAPREDDGGAGSAGEDGGVSSGTLRLRAGTSRRGGNRVVWDENVVDNEGAGKKKSKSELWVWSMFLSEFNFLCYFIIAILVSVASC